MREPIEPDTKDWTWVLRRPCTDCGFDVTGMTPPLVAARIRELLPRWAAVLARPDAGERPAPGVWSPLEYGAHVRDMSGVFDGRLHALLEEENPVFADWDQDAAAGDYADEDPAAVAAAIRANGERLAASTEATRPEQWDRPGQRSDGAPFTVRTLAHYGLHEYVHHTADVAG